MPKSGLTIPAAEARSVRSVFKAISNRNRLIHDRVEPTLKGTKDQDRVKKIVRLFRTEKNVRDIARSDLLAFGIRPRRRRRPR